MSSYRQIRFTKLILKKATNVFGGHQMTRTYFSLQCRKAFTNGLIQKLSYANKTSKADDKNESLTDYQAYDMVHKLTDGDRAALTKALNQFESNKIKSKFQGELASSKWRMRFGKRENATVLGSVDPTGTYCAMPDDWLQKKLAEATVAPSRDVLTKVCMAHGLPFVGFGFLDNFFMIIMGDYIEGTIGVYLCLSTMGAAAWGNTISDILGLGLAHYVETFFLKLGMEPPKLTPTQAKMAITQRIGALGRVLGITIGCTIGMFPLLFIGNKDEKKEEKGTT